MPLSARRARRRRVKARAVGLPTRLLSSALDSLAPSALILLLLRWEVLELKAWSRHPELLRLDALARVLFEEPRLLWGLPLAWMLMWTAFTLAQLGFLGTTLGKHLLQLQIRQRDGRPAATLRHLARVGAAWLVPATLGLSYLWIAVNPDRRAWHDLLSGTYVVRLSGPPG